MSATADKTECEPVSTGAPLKRRCENSEDEPPKKILEVCRESRQALWQSDDSWTPLHTAAWHGRVEKVKKLLAEGASTRAQDSKGCTALHTALYFMEEEAAECIADADSSNNLQDKDGQTPLHVAARYGYEKIVGKLLEGGADASLRDTKGKMPFHYVTERELVDIAKELLFSGAHPHIEDGSGRHPLIFPLMMGQVCMVRVTLSMCAFRDIVINWKEYDFKPKHTRYCIEYLSKCYAEVQYMKDCQVEGCPFSYYDIAKGRLVKVARCLGNGAVRNVLHRDLKHDFPNYAELIAFQVRRAERRRALTRRCRGCCAVLSRKLTSLSKLSMDVIFSCLSELDMHNLIKAFKLPL